MTASFISYVLYLLIIVGIIGRVGLVIHKIGRVYIAHFFPSEKFGKQINDLLLLGYYLLNIGYSLYVLTFGAEQITDAVSSLEWLTHKIGGIVLLLGVLHINNMLLIYAYYRQRLA